MVINIQNTLKSERINSPNLTGKFELYTLENPVFPSQSIRNSPQIIREIP